MYWSYMTLRDDTEVTFSETGGDGSVGVWIETPIETGFKSAHCLIPSFEWDVVDGYSDDELLWFESFLRNNAPLIMEMSRENTFTSRRSIA